MRRFLVLIVVGSAMLIPQTSQAVFCEERERVCDQKGRVYTKEADTLTGTWQKTSYGGGRGETANVYIGVDDFFERQKYELGYTVNLTKASLVKGVRIGIDFCPERTGKKQGCKNRIRLAEKTLMAKRRRPTKRVRYYNYGKESFVSQGTISFSLVDALGKHLSRHKNTLETANRSLERGPGPLEGYYRRQVESSTKKIRQLEALIGFIRDPSQAPPTSYLRVWSSRNHGHNFIKYDVSIGLRVPSIKRSYQFALPCAQETVTYDCKADDYINNCAGLQQVEGCGQISSECTATDQDGQCGHYRDTYRCGNPIGPVSGATQLPVTHTISDERLEGCLDEEAGGNCQRTGRQCVEGAGTRNIGGLDVTRDCWRWEHTYACLSDTTVDDCTSLEAAPDCREESNDCLSEKNGRCVHWEHRYRCGGGAGDGNPVARCGAQTYCVGGNCRSLDYAPNTDFALAVAWLNKLKSASEDFAQPPAVFTGEGRTCKKSLANFQNCCSDSGWGVKLGLAGCKPEEKKLSVANKQGQTHYVGTYCATKAIFICLVKKRSYCQFKSRLARVLQQQVRPQLSIDWGHPKSPDCRALTIDELQRVNWQQVDLSEVYNELLAKVQIPNEDLVGQAVEQRVQRRLSQGRPPKPRVPQSAGAN